MSTSASPPASCRTSWPRSGRCITHTAVLVPLGRHLLHGGRGAPIRQQAEGADRSQRLVQLPLEQQFLPTLVSAVAPWSQRPANRAKARRRPGHRAWPRKWPPPSAPSGPKVVFAPHVETANGIILTTTTYPHRERRRARWARCSCSTASPRRHVGTCRPPAWTCWVSAAKAGVARPAGRHGDADERAPGHRTARQHQLRLRPERSGCRSPKATKKAKNAYHTTMPTDALVPGADVMQRRANTALPKVRARNRSNWAAGARAALLKTGLQRPATEG